MAYWQFQPLDSEATFFPHFFKGSYSPGILLSGKCERKYSSSSLSLSYFIPLIILSAKVSFVKWEFARLAGIWGIFLLNHPTYHQNKLCRVDIILFWGIWKYSYRNTPVFLSFLGISSEFFYIGPFHTLCQPGQQKKKQVLGIQKNFFCIYLNLPDFLIVRLTPESFLRLMKEPIHVPGCRFVHAGHRLQSLHVSFPNSIQ